MPVLLADWIQDEDWTENNRTYTGEEYPEIDTPDGMIPIEERHTYHMKFDISMSLFDSPCKSCTVVLIRRRTNVEFTGIYKNEYLGGLNKWSDDNISKYADEQIEIASSEAGGGLLDCVNCPERYHITWTESPSYTPPQIPELPPEKPKLPADVAANIEVLERFRDRKPPQYMVEQIEKMEERKQEEINAQANPIVIHRMQESIDSLKKAFDTPTDKEKEEIQKEIDDLKKKYAKEE